jgi:hypothetical protein
MLLFGHSALTERPPATQTARWVTRLAQRVPPSSLSVTQSVHTPQSGARYGDHTNTATPGLEVDLWRCAVRLVRLGAAPSRIGADVRAALTSWGPTDAIFGGIALLGCTPLGCAQPVEAVVLMPRGVLVVVGVDLPDPAMRLDAPLTEQWKTDGWPLIRPDGAVNPAGDALAAATAVTQRLQRSTVESVPVGTVIAVGPFVSQVVQPTVDLHRGVRVLHPQSKSMLAAARELSVYERPCTIEQARSLLAALVGDRVNPTVAELTAEGFQDVVARDLANAQTTLLPRIADSPAPARSGGRPKKRGMRWLPLSALALLGLLLITGITVAISSSGGGGAAVVIPATPTPSKVADVTLGGQRFTPEGSAQGQDCATHAYGDVQVWLAQHPCVSLERSLYQTILDNQPAAVALAVVGFTDAATASAFAAEANTPGSGGINDLVKDGRRWTDGPASFDNAAYAVSASATSVRLTEVVWVGRPTNPTDPTLTQLATRAAGLPAVP